eukprot:IDg12029t1
MFPIIGLIEDALKFLTADPYYPHIKHVAVKSDNSNQYSGSLSTFCFPALWIKTGVLVDSQEQNKTHDGKNLLDGYLASSPWRFLRMSTNLGRLEPVARICVGCVKVQLSLVSSVDYEYDLEGEAVQSVAMDGCPVAEIVRRLRVVRVFSVVMDKIAARASSHSLSSLCDAATSTIGSIDNSAVPVKFYISHEEEYDCDARRAGAAAVRPDKYSSFRFRRDFLEERFHAVDSCHVPSEVESGTTLAYETANLDDEGKARLQDAVQSSRASSAGVLLLLGPSRFSREYLAREYANATYMQFSGAVDEAEENQVIEQHLIFAPGWSNHASQEKRTERFLALMTDIATRYIQNGAFIRGHEASEESITTTDKNGLPLLTADDIPLPASTTNFCVDFGSQQTPRTAGAACRRKRASSSESESASDKRNRNALALKRARPHRRRADPDSSANAAIIPRTSKNLCQSATSKKDASLDTRASTRKQIIVMINSSIVFHTNGFGKGW